MNATCWYGQVAKEILESFKSFSLLGSTSHPPVPKVTIMLLPKFTIPFPPRCSSVARLVKTLSPLLTFNTVDPPSLSLRLGTPCLAS